MKRLLFFTALLCVTITMQSQDFVEWTGFGDGQSWDDPFNWDREGIEEVPQYGDDVFIDGGFVSYYGDGNIYASIELTGGTNLLIQSNLNTSYFYIDEFSDLTVDLYSLSDYSKVICDYYYIVGYIDLLFSNYVPQIGNTYQFIEGEQDECSIDTVEFVSDTEAAGFEVTLTVQCQPNGILHTVTGINYTTAKYWTGAGGNNSWQTAANWNNGQLPDTSSIVIINLPSGATVSTNGAGTTSVYSMSIGENNTLVVNGNLEIFSSIKNNETGTIVWNGGTISKTTSPATSVIMNYGAIEINTSILKTIENGFGIWNYGTINHNQGDLNIDNGQIIDFSGSEYNINGDNITIGYDSSAVGSHNFFHLSNSTLRKSLGSGSGTSSINLDNFSAFLFSDIVSDEGTLVFGEITADYTTFGGSGQFQLPNNHVVNGNISPGEEILVSRSETTSGTLTFAGDFTTSTSSVYKINVFGPNAGSEYDQIVVTNEANLEGNIEMILGYAPATNASFEILTAANLNSCNFPAQITGNFSGTDYTFDVVCNGTSLFLNAPGVLSTDDEELSDVSIYPNPVRDYLHINSNNIDGSWKVYNQLGQIVKQGELGELQTRIYVKELNTGLYIVRIDDNNSNRTSTQKIIVSN